MKRQTSTCLISVAAASLVAGAVVAQAQFTLAWYEFGTPTTTSYASTDDDGLSTASDLSVAGYTQVSFNGVVGNPVYSLELGSGGTPAAWSSGSYLQFTITPDTGRQLNLTSFSFEGQVSGLTAGWSLRSDQDSYATDLGGGSFSNEGTWPTISAPDFGASFQGLADAVTFRFYLWDNKNGSQLMRLDNIQVTGTNVPEPASGALVAGLGLGAFAFLRRRVNR